MKLIHKILLLALITVSVFSACDKKDILATHQKGTANVLSSSTNIVLSPAADSNNTVLTLNWTDPQFATNKASYKYVIEMDSTGKNFAKVDTRTVTGQLSTSFTAKELTNLLLARGYAFNVAADMEFRLKSSYSNNNELQISNVLKIKITPYKIPPKIAVPASGRLFIVGSGTAGGDATGWNNPVPVPSQEFSRIDETTWGGVFQLTGGKSYLLLPTNNNVWDIKYGGAGSINNSNNVDGDNFKVGGSDLKTPATSGMYKIIFDFQQGKFTVTPYTGTLATELYIVGNATPGGDATGWDNPVPVPSQQFTRVNSSLFELTIALNPGKSYLFLPVNGSWTNKYGGVGTNNSNNVNGDDFKYNGSDMKAPAVAGTYKISVNFAASNVAGASGKTTLVKQ
jgi:hypothetical protein